MRARDAFIEIIIGAVMVFGLLFFAQDIAESVAEIVNRNKNTASDITGRRPIQVGEKIYRCKESK